MMNTSLIELNGEKVKPKIENKLLLLCQLKMVITDGLPFTGIASKVPEPYAVKVAHTVLWGRKLPGATIIRKNDDRRKS
jgi:hypothetical protein